MVVPQLDLKWVQVPALDRWNAIARPAAAAAISHRVFLPASMKPGLVIMMFARTACGRAIFHSQHAFKIQIIPVIWSFEYTWISNSVARIDVKRFIGSTNTCFCLPKSIQPRYRVTLLYKFLLSIFISLLLKVIWAPNLSFFNVKPFARYTNTLWERRRTPLLWDSKMIKSKIPRYPLVSYFWTVSKSGATYVLALGAKWTALKRLLWEYEMSKNRAGWFKKSVCRIPHLLDMLYELLGGPKSWRCTGIGNSLKNRA